MKTTPLALVLLFALCLAGSTLRSASTPAPVDQANRIPPETVQLKVLKVLSAKDGEHLYRSYLVAWKEQEVAVPDSLVQTKYNVGDTIPVLVMRHPYPQGREPHGLLNFTVVPVRR